MGVFDLRVRLIPDSSAIRKELQARQREGIQRGVRGTSNGVTGAAAIGGGIGAGLGEMSIKGFGKMLAVVGGISAIFQGLKPIIEPVMKMLQAILLILFIPLIPILKPLLMILAEMAKKLVPVMLEISKKVEEALNTGGIGEALGVLFDEITEKVLIPGFEKLATQFIPKLIPILIDGFISFVSALVTPKNIGSIGEALITGFKNLVSGLIEVLKENWKEILIGFLLIILTGIAATLLAAITGLTLGWAVVIGALIIGAIIFIAKKISDNWTTIVNTIKDTWNNFISSLKNIFTSILNKVKTFLSDLPIIGGAFRKRQLGGPVNMGGSFLVGERGPELFVPSGSGKIVPNNQLMSGGQTITININNPSVRQEADIKRLADEISRVLASSQRRRFS